jgi:hypothetical protein
MATVFLSYRHENSDHSERVRVLGQRLNDASIDVVLDQFFLDAHPGGPDQGWPRWSKEMASETERVLVIGSPSWFRCYEGKELPGTGLGASAETVIINQRLYNAAGVTGEIRIALFEPLDPVTLPLDLQGFHRFNSIQDFDAICRWIKGESAIPEAGHPAAAAGGWLAAPPVFEWLLADCEPVHQAFSALLTAPSEYGVLLIRGGSETGKSHLTKSLLALLMQNTSFACGRFDLKNAADLEAEYSRFVQNLRVDDAVRVSRGRPLRERLDEVLASLRAAAAPAVLIFDTFEQGGDFQRWVEGTVLLAVPRSPWLRVIVAGQQVPNRTGSAWAHYTGPIIDLQRLELKPWLDFGKRNWPGLTEDMARKIYDRVDGSHSLLGQLFGPQP